MLDQAEPGTTDLDRRGHRVGVVDAARARHAGLARAGERASRLGRVSTSGDHLRSVERPVGGGERAAPEVGEEGAEHVAAVVDSARQRRSGDDVGERAGGGDLLERGESTNGDRALHDRATLVANGVRRLVGHDGGVVRCVGAHAGGRAHERAVRCARRRLEGQRRPVGMRVVGEHVDRSRQTGVEGQQVGRCDRRVVDRRHRHRDDAERTSPGAVGDGVAELVDASEVVTRCIGALGDNASHRAVRRPGDADECDRVAVGITVVGERAHHDRCVLHRGDHVGRRDGRTLLGHDVDGDGHGLRRSAPRVAGAVGERGDTDTVGSDGQCPVRTEFDDTVRRRRHHLRAQRDAGAGVVREHPRRRDRQHLALTQPVRVGRRARRRQLHLDGDRLDARDVRAVGGAIGEAVSPGEPRCRDVHERVERRRHVAVGRRRRQLDVDEISLRVEHRRRDRGRNVDLGDRGCVLHDRSRRQPGAQIAKVGGQLSGDRRHVGSDRRQAVVDIGRRRGRQHRDVELVELGDRFVDEVVRGALVDEVLTFVWRQRIVA